MYCKHCGDDTRELKEENLNLRLRIEELEKQSSNSVDLLMQGEALRSKMMLEAIMNGAFNHIAEGKKNAPVD